MRGVVLDMDTIDRSDLDLKGLEATLPSWRFHSIADPEDVVTRLRGAAVAVTNKVLLDARLLESLPDLKFICIAATGTNNVDLEAARRLGLPVSNVRHYAGASVAQHVFALILALTVRLDDYRQAVARGDWQASPYFCLLDFPIRELAGKTLGIVGHGDLGQAVGRLGEAFGMDVLVAGRRGMAAPAGRAPFEEVLARADVLTLHCPLTDETRGMIGAAELARMKPDAVLINTARGGLVDEAALAAALRAGRLGGAGMDVLTREPPVDGNLLIDPTIPNLIVTPHIAWASREARQRVLDDVATSVRAFLAGTPRNLVT